MTLPPERIGDKGQRYMVEVAGMLDDTDVFRPAAYSTRRAGAEDIAAAFNLRPGATARVIDRGEIPAPPYVPPPIPLRFG